MSGERWTVVTGAADGIGSALVKRLSDLGHHVLAVDKDGDKLQHVLRHNSDLIRGLCVDISDKKTPYLIVEALPTGAKVNYLVSIFSALIIFSNSSILNKVSQRVCKNNSSLRYCFHLSTYDMDNL